MITLFHDYTSPTAAVAVRRAERLAPDRVEFEGFEAIGIDMVLPVTVDVLAELDSVAEAATAEGIVLRRPRQLPPTGWCHVLGAVAAREDRAPEWRRTVYAAFWRDGADIGDREVLARLADEVGLDTDRVASALDDRGALAAVRRHTTEFRRQGIGGVPTILSQRTLVPGLLPEADLRALAEL